MTETSTPPPTRSRCWHRTSLQIVEGGISAGYFNALEKNLPVTIVLDRVSTPIGHNLMLRPDLKDQITDLRQLKGKTIASNGPGSVSTYEVGKMLESDGLTLADVDIKVIPFTQMASRSTTRRSTPRSSFRRSSRNCSTAGMPSTSRTPTTSSSRTR